MTMIKIEILSDEKRAVIEEWMSLHPVLAYQIQSSDIKDEIKSLRRQIERLKKEIQKLKECEV